VIFLVNKTNERINEYSKLTIDFILTSNKQTLAGR